MKFCYYEIRPCVEHEGTVASFLGEPEYIESIGDSVCTPDGAFREAEAYHKKVAATRPVFWTVYGHNSDGRKIAIGDFKSFDDALEIMNAILAPLGHIWRTIDDHPTHALGVYRDLNTYLSAYAMDVCNQSTNNVRL